MLSHIKAYQSERERESALFFTKLSFMLYTGHLFTEGLLSALKHCYVCLHSHKMFWLYRLDGLVGSLNPPNR